ncbi:Phosphate-specific transport system accessory protein PhoU [bacterium HR17]|jgi:phosphate transport system protein|uniref:Phosphate-specific transport system accessory protein PhoU n=1 Tax=Candidatus Fervidibacter japonicus TaxID=2035412 RepID=A0A2H5XDB5_9BACT|nr:Phosphate-specific transport system accessory protein PhoU [bacterium HR17]
MAVTIRKSFEEQLQELQDDLLRMGRFVEGAVAKAMKALTTQDIALANEVIREDDIADDLDVEIETKAMRLLALQQPMARDLRLIGTALKIVTDLERIGDHAVDIAKLARILARQTFFKPLVDIPRLAQLALNMVHNALQAYVNRDIELAIQVCRDDDQVDDLYESLFAELVDYMKRDPSLVEQATYLLFAAYFLERIADHATNMAERVYYMETGRLEQLARSHRSREEPTP